MDKTKPNFDKVYVPRCGTYGECEPVGSNDYTCICQEGYQLHTDRSKNVKTCVEKNTVCEFSTLFITTTRTIIFRSHFYNLNDVSPRVGF